MPFRRILRGPPPHATLEDYLEEHDLDPALAELLLALDSAYKRFARRLLVGMGVAVLFSAAAIGISYVRTGDAIDEVAAGRQENIKTGCKLRQDTNNVILSVIDFTVDPETRRKGEPPPDPKVLAAFLALVEPLRPPAQELACRKLLDAAGFPDAETPDLKRAVVPKEAPDAP